MADLTYQVHELPTRAFVKGDQVETVDRDGTPMSKQTVTKADDKIVYTSCGRRWTQEGSWWNGKEAYPFPTIRHLASD